MLRSQWGVHFIHMYVYITIHKMTNLTGPCKKPQVKQYATIVRQFKLTKM